MDLMVNPVITDFQQDVNGDIKMLKIGQKKEDAWANIAEQGASAKLDNNKTATINVSTYTEPVVINPTSGKDGMKKATVTLTNIPSGSGNTMYYWEATAEEVTAILPFNVFPAEVSGSTVVAMLQIITGQKTISTMSWTTFLQNGEVEKLSDTSFRIVFSEQEGVTFSLVTTTDVTIDSLFGIGTTWVPQDQPH